MTGEPAATFFTFMANLKRKDTLGSCCPRTGCFDTGCKGPEDWPMVSKSQTQVRFSRPSPPHLGVLGPCREPRVTPTFDGFADLEGGALH